MVDLNADDRICRLDVCLVVYSEAAFSEFGVEEVCNVVLCALGGDAADVETASLTGISDAFGEVVFDGAEGGYGVETGVSTATKGGWQVRAVLAGEVEAAAHFSLKRGDVLHTCWFDIPASSGSLAFGDGDGPFGGWTAFSRAKGASLVGRRACSAVSAGAATRTSTTKAAGTPEVAVGRARGASVVVVPPRATVFVVIS